MKNHKRKRDDITVPIDPPVDEEIRSKKNGKISNDQSNSHLSQLSFFEINGDGNCLFSAISYCLYRDQSLHFRLRQIACDHINENQWFFFDNVTEDFNQYLQRMRKNNEWGTELELLALSRSLGFNVDVTNDERTMIYYSIFHHAEFPKIYLEFINGNHYNCLLSHLRFTKISANSSVLLNADIAKMKNKYKNIDFSASISEAGKEIINAVPFPPIPNRVYKISKAIKRKVISKKSNSNINKNKASLNSNNNPQNSAIVNSQNNISNPTSSKSHNLNNIKKQISSQTQNRNFNNIEAPKVKCFIYPTTKFKSNMYNEVYQYLSQNKIPDRFKGNKSTTSFKNWHKNFKQYYTLSKICNSTLSKSRLIYQDERKNKFIIPFIHEIKKIIEICHGKFIANAKHFGRDLTVRNIKSRGFYWANMTNDTADFIVNCEECALNIPAKPIKSPKIILANGPLDRIQLDLWSIPKFMIEKSLTGDSYKYVLSAQDHFSKFKWAILISDKTAENICQKLEIILASFTKIPKIIQTDNGKEFRNHLLVNLTQRYNIQLIHGAVRHPQTQGLVENQNGLLSKSLTKSFTNYLNKNKNGKKWDLVEAISYFIATENNKVHTVTKEIPNKLVHEVQEDKIKLILERIQNYYKKITQKSKIIKIGAKVAILRDMQLNKKKKSLVPAVLHKFSRNFSQRIPAEVTNIDNIDKNNIKIKIDNKSLGNILLNGEVNISTDSLMIISDKMWRTLSKNK